MWFDWSQNIGGIEGGVGVLLEYEAFLAVNCGCAASDLKLLLLLNGACCLHSVSAPRGESVAGFLSRFGSVCLLWGRGGGREGGRGRGSSVTSIGVLGKGWHDGS